MKKITTLFLTLMTLFCLMVMPFSEFVSAATEKTLTIHYVDQYGVPVAPSTVEVGEENDSITLTPAINPYFYIASTTPTYVFSDEDQQTYTFHYLATPVSAPRTYLSMFFDTAHTYTGFVGMEYGGNLGYFNYAEDDYIHAKFTASLGYRNIQGRMLTFAVDLPQGNKFKLEDDLNLRLFQNASGDQVLPLKMMDPDFNEGKLDLAAAGVSVEYWASLDQGATFVEYTNLTAQQKKMVSKVVGRIFFNQDINYVGERLYVVADLPLSLQDDRLTPSELAGTTPIQGWAYKTPDYSAGMISLDTNIYLLNPMIRGTIRSNTTKDWNSASALADHTVELIAVDALNQEQVIGMTKTDANGEYAFHQQIVSFDQIKIKVSNKDGYETYFYYLEPSTNEAYMEENHIGVGNLPEMAGATPINNILSWIKQPNASSMAEQSRNLDFLLVGQTPEDPNPGEPTLEELGTGPNTGDETNLVFYLLMLTVSITAAGILKKQQKQ